MHPARLIVGPTLAVAMALVLSACLPATIRRSPSALPSATPTSSPALPVTPAPTPGPPTPTPGPAWVLHTVVRGDTLVSLARQYGTSGRSIAYWNRETYPSLDPESADYAPNSLKRGWVLRVLEGQEYVPPADDGETGEQVTPAPEETDDYVEESSSPEVVEPPVEEPTE